MEQTVAASSPAEVDVFQGRNDVTHEEWSNYRKDPDNFKPAEPADTAPADAPKETASEGDEPESAGDPETPKDSQEKAQPKKLNANGRAAQLDRLIEAELDKENPDPDKIAHLQKTRDRVLDGAEVKRKTESAPVTQPQAQQQPPHQQPQTFEQWYETFDADKWEQGFIEANPSLSYPRVNAAMHKFLGDVRDQFRDHAQAQNAQLQQVRAEIEQVKAKFGNDFDLIEAAAGALRNDRELPNLIMGRILNSKDVPTLLHAIAQEPGGMEKFIATAKADVFRALDQIAVTDRMLAEKLSAESAAPPEQPPAPPKTQAPKPPSPVSAGSSRAFDVSDESLSPDEWMRKRNKQTGK